MDDSNLHKVLKQATSSTQQVGHNRRLAGLIFLIPIICMMLGGSNVDEGATIANRNETATDEVIRPGEAGGHCRQKAEGFCVPVGMCSPEDKIQGEDSICDAGLECCIKKLNNNLCASRGGECVAIGSCGEGIALFREAEDCNRARHGKDCCIWM